MLPYFVVGVGVVVELAREGDDDKLHQCHSTSIADVAVGLLLPGYIKGEGQSGEKREADGAYEEMETDPLTLLNHTRCDAPRSQPTNVIWKK